MGTRRIRSDVSLMLASMSLVWVTSSYLIKVTLTSEPQEKPRVPRGGRKAGGKGGVNNAVLFKIPAKVGGHPEVNSMKYYITLNSINREGNGIYIQYYNLN